MVNIILYKRKKIKGKFTIHNLWSTKLLEWSSNDKNDKNNRHTKNVISEKIKQNTLTKQKHCNTSQQKTRHQENRWNDRPLIKIKTPSGPKIDQIPQDLDPHPYIHYRSQCKIECIHPLIKETGELDSVKSYILDKIWLWNIYIYIYKLRQFQLYTLIL
jgi:hypothetical protein